MKAAALGHQYLSVKSTNENDIYLNCGRFRGRRKLHPKYSKEQQNEDQTNPNFPASDPLSRRSVAINENFNPINPTPTIFERTHSESNALSVVYEQQPSDHIRFQRTNGGINNYISANLE